MKRKNDLGVPCVQSDKLVRIAFKFKSGIYGTVEVNLPAGIDDFDISKAYYSITDALCEELRDA